ncbi:MAG: BlaI/MecI/CopY family transcriptional regulator [Thermoanaerobaculia bacterium]
MARDPLDLGRRERQLMEVVYRRGRATVGEVLASLPDPPSYSAVRTMLGKLERKGLLRHVADGARYVYVPTTPKAAAQRTTLRRVVRSLFDGSTSRAVTALLDLRADDLSEEELDALAARIEALRGEER